MKPFTMEIPTPKTESSNSAITGIKMDFSKLQGTTIYSAPEEPTTEKKKRNSKKKDG